MNNRQASEQPGEAGHFPGVEIYQSNGQNMSSSQQHEPLGPWQHPRRYSQGLHSMGSIEEEDNSGQGLLEREYRSAASARMAARRQSTMSRLGSRILPNSVIHGLLSSQEETPAEGRAHRHGLVSRTPPRSETATSSSRFSPFSALGSRGITRRRTSRTPYVLPPRADPLVATDSATNSMVDSNARRLPEPSRTSWRQSARLQHMRHSLSVPISHMFGQPQSDMPTAQESMSHSPPGQYFDESHPSAMDTQPDFGGPLPELNPLQAEPSQNGPLPSIRTNPGLAGMRRLPDLLRARSARALRREEQTPLSRVLQLAAAAIAAQLSGSNGPAVPDIEALGNEGLDGSLENFIQSLQHATSSQAHPAAPGEGPSNSGNETPSQPVNFLRVFRFANADSPLGPDASNPLGRNPTGSGSQSTASDGMPGDETPDNGEGRTVTLVVVGVRSVPAVNGSNGEQGPPGPGGPGLDALLGLPFLPPNAIPRPQGSTGDFSQRPDGSSRMQAPRSAGVPGFVRPPGTNPSRRLSDAGPLPMFPSFHPSALSESPPGPNPPPSTPAEQAMSAVSSGTSTPSRRPSSASTMSPNVLPQLHEGQPMQPTSEPAAEPMPPNAARQRRRSDSEYARHRAFGSGSVRRNGVVEPDQPPPSGGRSWLIYVVGTNLAENHPALTTPSLFTDVRISPACSIEVPLLTLLAEPHLRGHDPAFVTVRSRQTSSGHPR